MLHVADSHSENCCILNFHHCSQDVAGEEPTDPIPAEDEDWITDSVNRFDKLNTNGRSTYINMYTYIEFSYRVNHASFCRWPTSVKIFKTVLQAMVTKEYKTWNDM